MWQIIINGPGYFDTPYALPEGVTHLGRADENDIVLNGDLVSRQHARLLVKGGALQIEDVGSRNGLRVNGHPVDGQLALAVGDIISVGENTLSVRQPEEGERAVTELSSLPMGGVRRVAQEDDLRASVLVRRRVSGADVLRALDNFEPPPLADPFREGLAPAVAQPKVPYGALVLLFKTAEALGSATSLELFLDSTMDHLIERTEVSTAVVLLRDGLELAPASVRHRGSLGAGEVPISDAIVSQTLRDGHALVVADVKDDPRFASRDSVILYGVQRVLCIPLGAAPFLGVLYVNASERGDTALEVLLDTCAAVAHLVASGVEKLRSGGSPEQRLKRALARFHSPPLAARRLAEAQSSDGRLPGLEERTVTVLHAELADLEGHAQRAGPAETAVVMAEFQVRLAGLLFSYEASLDALGGEGIRAVFGAPYSKADDSIRAVRAALALQAEWAKWMAPRPADQRCGLRVALHTARVLVGMVQLKGPLSDGTPSFVAVGEGASLARLLAGVGEVGQVLITGKTLAATGARFDVVPLGERLLRPPRERTAVFEVIEEDLGQSTMPGIQ